MVLCVRFDSTALCWSVETVRLHTSTSTHNLLKCWLESNDQHSLAGHFIQETKQQTPKCLFIFVSVSKALPFFKKCDSFASSTTPKMQMDCALD